MFFRLLALFAMAAAASAAERPNILFLFADDQRPDTIGAWGNEHIRTPNLDRLAGEGFSFRRTYCLGAGGGAVCVPSRAMLHTGKSYFRIPMDMQGERTLGEILSKAGYSTFATGKWHNRRPSWLRSFERGRAVMFGGMSDHTDVPIHELDDRGRLIEADNRRQFSSELFADSTIEFLENYDEPNPFFAYVAFTAPHDPRQPPRRYRERYYRDRPPLPPNFMPQHPFNNGHMTGRDEELGAWPRTREMVSDQLAEYYGLITHLDEQVGRILEALEESGKAENTYVIYAADHGLAVGSHGLLGKQNIYEHPAIDGLDLRPVWESERRDLRDGIFLAFRNLMRSYRDERWKLIRYPQINHTQLFDLAADPHEMNNLAGDPAQAGRIEALMARLREAQQKMGDGQPLKVANPEPKEIDMAGRERRVDPWQPMWLIEKYFPGWF